MIEAGRTGRRHRRIPTSVLAAGGALLFVTAAVLDFGGQFRARPVAQDHVALLSRDLKFADRPDGGVIITDANDGSVVAQIEVGQDGFLRGAMRALARERRKEALGPETPFRLTAWKDGRLTLTDPATGASIALEAFGDTQKESFARYLIRTPQPEAKG